MRRSVVDMQALAAAKDGTFLGPLVNTQTKAGWRCAQGHEWMAIPNSIQQGSWCPYCAGRATKTVADMQALAAQRGGDFLGPYINTQTKAGWRCTKGHEWQATPGNVKNGHWCPHCYGNKPKTEADMHSLAAARGGTWLGPLVPVMCKTKWRCSAGHEWEAKYNNINNGKWCPVCSGVVRKTAEDMQALAASRGGVWLGPETRIMHKTRWRCAQGHEWQAKPNNIYSLNQWCPRCARNGPSRGQLQVWEWVKALLPDQEVLFGDRQTVKNPKTRRFLELDIYIPALKLAIEYNGEYWHGPKSPRGKRATSYDALKASLCREQGIKLLTVWEKDWQVDSESVRTWLKKEILT